MFTHNTHSIHISQVNLCIFSVDVNSVSMAKKKKTTHYTLVRAIFLSRMEGKQQCSFSLIFLCFFCQDNTWHTTWLFPGRCDILLPPQGVRGLPQSPGRMCLNYLQRWCPGFILIRCQVSMSLIPFNNMEQFYSDLFSDVWAPHFSLYRKCHLIMGKGFVFPCDPGSSTDTCYHS